MACATAFAPPAVLAWAAAAVAAVGDATGAAGAADEGEEAGAGAGDDAPPAVSPLAAAPDPPNALMTVCLQAGETWSLCCFRQARMRPPPGFTSAQNCCKSDAQAAFAASSAAAEGCCPCEDCAQAGACAARPTAPERATLRSIQIARRSKRDIDDTCCHLKRTFLLSRAARDMGNSPPGPRRSGGRTIGRARTSQAAVSLATLQPCGPQN